MLKCLCEICLLFRMRRVVFFLWPIKSFWLAVTICCSFCVGLLMISMTMFKL